MVVKFIRGALLKGEGGVRKEVYRVWKREEATGKRETGGLKGACVAVTKTTVLHHM